MSENATTPAKTETTTTPAPAKLDPFVESLVKSIDNVIDPTITHTEPEPMAAPPSLRDIVEQRVAAAQAPGGKPAEATTKPEEKPKDGETVTPPPAPETKVDPQPEVKPDLESQTKVVRKKITPPAETPPAPQTPPKEEVKTGELSADDQEYIKTLTPDQQDEIEIAQFAEAKMGKTGVVAKTLEYYRKVDKFIVDNPDVGQNDPAYKEFLEANRKHILTPAEKRKFERDLITEQAVERARKELEPAVETQKQTLRAIEARPVIEEAIGLVTSTMTTPPDKNLAPVPQDVVKVLRDQGYQAAVDQFPIEAPIVSGALNAVQAYMQISRGVTPFDEKNNTHAWLARFVAEEGARFKRQPADITTRGGRTFLPIHEYLAAQREGKADNHWTFDENMIVDLIGSNAVLGVNAKFKELEKAGFVRQNSAAKGKPAETTTPATATITGSPRAGSTALPGVGGGESELSEIARYIESRAPGAASRLGLK